MPLTYLSNFWRTLEMLSINCEVTLDLKWSENKKVPLSTWENAKLLQQLKSVFKSTINWNKYQSKPSTEIRNRYLDCLTSPSVQGPNRLFVLSFENDDSRLGRIGYLQKTEIKNCNAKIGGRNFFDQPIDNDIKRNENIRKIDIGQRDDSTTGC